MLASEKTSHKTLHLGSTNVRSISVTVSLAIICNICAFLYKKDVSTVSVDWYTAELAYVREITKLEEQVSDSKRS